MTTPSEDAIQAEVDAAALELDSLSPLAFAPQPTPGPRALDWELLNFARWNIECRWRARADASSPKQLAQADREIADFSAQLTSLGFAINDPYFLYAMQATCSVLSHTMAQNVGTCVNRTEDTEAFLQHLYGHVTDGLNDVYFWLRSRFISLGVPAPHEPAPGEQPPRGHSPGTS